MIKSFLQFLSEQNKGSETIPHISTPNTHDSVGTHADFLKDLHNNLLGKDTKTEFHHHYSGMPIQFGINPKNGKHFVNTPGKSPNFSHREIDNNYSNSPEVAEKLKTALNELPKITPTKGGVYHGSLLYTKPDIQTKKDHHEFNSGGTIYSAHKNSKEGKDVNLSNMGLVIHSQEKNGNIVPLDKKTREKFIDHPDVNNIDPNIKVNPLNYTLPEQKEYHTHMGLAQDVYSKMKPEAFDAIKGHENLMKDHVDEMHKNNKIPTFNSYVNHLSKTYEDRINDAATPEQKQNRNSRHSEMMKQAIENKDHFDKILKFHHHLKNAATVLKGISDKNHPFALKDSNSIPKVSERIIGINNKTGEMVQHA